MKSNLFIQLSFIFITTFSIPIFSQTELNKHLKLHYEFNGDGKNLVNEQNNLKIEIAVDKRMFTWDVGKEGKPGSAIKFLGNSDGLKTNLDVSPESLPELTYIAWVYGKPIGYIFGTSLPHDDNNKNTSRTLQISKKNVTALFNKWTSDKKPFYANLYSTELDDKKWNFIALSVSARDSTITLFANNEYYELKKEEKAFFTNKKNNLIIGSSKSNNYGNKLFGIIDEIRVYDKALTVEELSQISGISFKSANDRIERKKLLNEILLSSLIIFLLGSIIYMIYVLFTEKKYKKITEKDFQRFVEIGKSNPDIEAPIN